MHLQSIFLLVLLTPFASGAPFFESFQWNFSPSSSSQKENSSGVNSLTENSGYLVSMYWNGRSANLLFPSSDFFSRFFSAINGFQKQASPKISSGLTSRQPQSKSVSSRAAQSSPSRNLNDFFSMFFGGVNQPRSDPGKGCIFVI